jgi:hypothetical protein
MKNKIIPDEDRSLDELVVRARNDSELKRILEGKPEPVIHTGEVVNLKLITKNPFVKGSIGVSNIHNYVAGPTHSYTEIDVAEFGGVFQFYSHAETYGDITHVSFSPNDDYIMVADRLGIYVFDMNRKELNQKMKFQADAPIKGIASLSPTRILVQGNYTNCIDLVSNNNRSMTKKVSSLYIGECTGFCFDLKTMTAGIKASGALRCYEVNKKGYLDNIGGFVLPIALIDADAFCFCYGRDYIAFSLAEKVQIYSADWKQGNLIQVAEAELPDMKEPMKNLSCRDNYIFAPGGIFEIERK